jgi:hypothetical protein
MKHALKLITLGLIFASSSAFGCKILVDNDTKNPVRAIDLGGVTQENQQSAARLISILPDETKQINTNPDVHARINIFVGSLIYHVQQIACSKNHKIKIKVSDLLKDKFNEKLLKVTKKASLNTLQPRKVYHL